MDGENGSACINPCRGMQQITAQRQKQAATTIGEKPEVTEAWKACGQHVLQQAAQELFMSKNHHS
jgi:hypothetical protein